MSRKSVSEKRDEETETVALPFRNGRRMAWENDVDDDNKASGYFCCLYPWLKSIWTRKSTASDKVRSSTTLVLPTEILPDPPTKTSRHDEHKVASIEGPEQYSRQSTTQDSMDLLSISSTEDSTNLDGDRDPANSVSLKNDESGLTDIISLDKFEPGSADVITLNNGEPHQADTISIRNDEPGPANAMSPNNSETELWDDVIPLNNGEPHQADTISIRNDEPSPSDAMSPHNSETDPAADQYEDDFESFNDSELWDSSVDAAETSDDEVWSIASDDNEEDVDPDTLNDLLSSVAWNDTTTHLKSLINFCKCTISKAESALHKWLNISRGPFPSAYKGQEKSEAIEYLSDPVRYCAEDFLDDVTRTLGGRPPRLFQEIDTLRTKQKSFLNRFHRNKVPKKSWPTNSRELAWHYLDASFDKAGNSIHYRIRSKDDAKTMKIIEEVDEEDESEEENGRMVIR